ncbi:MAG: hypothetical protein EOP04_31005 [Proteobacteria bacterium]|nr:MAG: hypothetical protein EOP04_31005 [Pseudomonadota bacterium]
MRQDRIRRGSFLDVDSWGAYDFTTKDIKAFQLFCEKHLEEWNVWMEDKASTPMWCHIQKRPVPGKRVFKP